MKAEEALQEIARVVGNPRKFYEQVKISDPKRGAILFEMWPHLMELIDSFEADRLHVVLKPRQVGISWLIAAYALKVALTRPNSRVLLISMGEREAIQLLRKCRFIYQYLPDWLKFNLSYDSATLLGFKGLDSTIMALPSTEAAGRGEACTLVVCDEWDYREFAESNFAAIKPTIDAGGQLIGVSTVDKEKTDSFFKRVFRGAMAGENNFKAHFYPYDVRPGRTPEWYAEMEREYPEHIREQEYPRSIEEALSPLSARAFFDKDKMFQLLRDVEEPIYEKPYLWIYREPKVGIRYVAGVDVGEGIGGDYSTLTIIGREGMQGEVVAVINTNIITTDIFAYEVDRLCRRYFNALLGVENNSLGLAVINKLLDLQYPRLYHGGKEKKKAGVTTTAFDRTTHLVELAENIKNGSLVTKCKTQVLQMIDYIWKIDEKRTRPEGGKHDDLVISFMIANQMLKHQYNVVPEAVIYT